MAYSERVLVSFLPTDLFNLAEKFRDHIGIKCPSEQEILLQMMSQSEQKILNFYQIPDFAFLNLISTHLDQSESLIAQGA
ncbi:hypothetical protein PM8797T_02519 [Gimesia maris DSM 8797]|uniref:Uncharacterized protein n=1 Tax=Gimesia maris TaxID=122 RepID=A0ABX5YK20_9PLAN|nr:hypothetical protein PM8797T_02519 [Gimesia maris DSM 8797]QEG16061.1 hypothetical protein GmarT_19220 [Gimesia maris]